MNRSESYTMRAVAYYRVSTDRQGRSGLGLDAQKQAVHGFVKQYKLKLHKELVEVESGKGGVKRDKLELALDYCRKHEALLLIAKLDRLGRNVAFISALMESEVRFIAVDNPQATEFLLHIMAAVAQQERRTISERTKDALQAAKRRGVKLGVHGAKVLSRKNRQESIRFARRQRQTIKALMKEGFVTIRDLVNELNRRKIPTYYGKRWHPATVHKVLTILKQFNLLN